MKADVFATFQLVGRAIFDAVKFGCRESSMAALNPLGLYAENHRARIKPSLSWGFLILRLPPGPCRGFIQRVHVAGIKIEPLVEVISTLIADTLYCHRRSGRAFPAIRHCHWFHSRVRHQEKVLTARPILVHHGLGEHTR